MQKFSIQIIQELEIDFNIFYVTLQHFNYMVRTASIGIKLGQKGFQMKYLFSKKQSSLLNKFKFGTAARK